MAKSFILLVVTLGIICGCSKSGLETLPAETRDFIYGSGRVALLGKPINGVADCEFANSQQGYVFKKVDNKLFIDSLRPSGTNTHKVDSIKRVGNGFEVIAENGIKSKFTLSFSNQGDDTIDIAFNDLDKNRFLRCEY